ncbi:hypothetical protein [Frateuria aurantia]|uniref:hypothetical protein n=1 Tax=Frateuria aurantia TaxID=81475 RepID=UPI0012E9B855|nr:hypothetical protein [Frateuria aurantia]
MLKTPGHRVGLDHPVFWGRTIIVFGVKYFNALRWKLQALSCAENAAAAMPAQGGQGLVAGRRRRAWTRRAAAGSRPGPVCRKGFTSTDAVSIFQSGE